MQFVSALLVIFILIIQKLIKVLLFIPIEPYFGVSKIDISLGFLQ